MGSIKDVDNQFSESLNNLFGQINSYGFDSPVTFIANKEVDKESITTTIPANKGVYLIEIKIVDTDATFDEWLAGFEKILNHERYSKSNVPSLKKLRCKSHRTVKLGEWFPLYIGKSKNIQKRVLEHLHLRLEQRTTGLKLTNREEFHGNSFRISTIVLDVINYDIIATEFERQLRNRINPILGRQ
ncbi:hypothetical protein [Flavobacterium subsaxonicum]|uniref:GIY-YIG domain-containing protein n=1 Tax=Flavobacterium subsaxonicum WB 4.1-42 = DSM 21790 TaxID=1121898 RepID=A0A0A2N2Q2_9FLAO|nr:hypothetical protein [Flavobacterium subsaxonicum]KGO94725.1 hypothetical protein Q766_01020 [Flavobacterium subsaxonicum WB 4.1-42 = DSM 21790]